MTSPAQRHMMRVSAAMTAQREAAPLRHATVYEQMLVKLAADQRTLKAIYSKELKAAKKRELLPFWLPWVNGVLEQGKGAQDDILMTVMLWRLDTDDIAGALEIARYALKYGLTMPGKHRRTPPYMFTEEVALAAMRAHAAGESVDTRLLTETLELTAAADMPDEVRAKLHKITGLFLRDGGDAAGALAHLQRATQLDCQAGVKKEIERLERELKPKPEPQPKAATRATRKTRSVTPAKRGRPKRKPVNNRMRPRQAARRSVRVNHLTLHRRPPPDFSEVVMMTLIIPRKEAPVSGEGTVVIPQPAGDEPVIKNTFFFPISTRSASGNVCALSRPSPPPVCVRPSSQAWRKQMRSCTSTANRKLPPVLRVWRTFRRTISTVKVSKFFTTSAPCVRWRPRRFMSVTAAWMPVRKETRRPTALTAPLMSCGGICAGQWRASRTSRAAS